MLKRFVKCSLKNEQPFRLVPFAKGMHQFGGHSLHTGTVPGDSNVPVQLVLLLSLEDTQVPIHTDPRITVLPLFYPFKYGGGGPEIQYAVLSDTEIEILYMSDPIPDEPERQYLQVPELPQTSLDLVPLTYEQARILTFMRGNGFFQPNSEDRAILHDLDTNNLITLGGLHDYIPNAPAIICRNRECERYTKAVYFRLIAMVPPLPVNGDDEFWYEFRGGDVNFCFGVCHYCHTIIAFNVAD